MPSTLPTISCQSAPALLQRSRYAASIYTLLALLSSVAVHGAAITWQGNTDGNLQTAANWVGGVAPVSNTDAYVFGTAGTGGTSLTLAAGFSINNTGGGAAAIDFTSGGSAYTFGGAGQLTVSTGGLLNSSGQTQTFNNPFRFNTGSQHTLTNSNSALVFNNTITLTTSTTTFSLGGSGATGQAITFGGNLADATARSLVLNGSTASTVNINGSANTGLGTLTIGSNVRVNLGSATALGSASTVTMNASNATLANTSGSALTTAASLGFNTATQNYTFGATGHTAANNITLTGTTAISADQTRTITLNGTGLTVTSASTWNNSVTGNRSLTINGAGNTFTLGGLAIGASGETANVTFTQAGSGNLAVTGGITNGQGSGTRSLQVNSTGFLTTSGTSTYDGTTGIGGSATLLVNGTHTGGGNYSVGGTLGGTGTINLASGAAVSFSNNSGNFGGKLQASSQDSLVFSGGAATLLNLTNAVAPTAAPSLFFTLGAPGSTVVDVQGGLNIGSGTFNFNDFSFTVGAGFGAGVYTLFDYTSITGTFGTSLVGTIGGLNAVISQDLVNTSIIVTTSAIPEPSTYAVLAGLAGLGFAALRRRRA